MRRVSASLIVCLGFGCAPAPPVSAPAASASASVAPPGSVSASASAAPSTSASVEPPKPADPPLPVSSTHTLERVFEGPADFFITGEKGRLAVISREDGQAVPHRFQNGKWDKIALPKPIPAASLHAGIYFGRDNLPRLMGWRDDGAVALVYLHFTGGKWEDAKKEIGGMAKQPATPLFGVLGEADPEAVCRIADPADTSHKIGDTCLMKRRSGWKQKDSGLPADAIVRAFEGTGYALHAGGLFKEGEKAFAVLGPSQVPWKTPRGFWIGPDGEAIVAADAALYVLAKGATEWKVDALPSEARDVVGPIDAPTVVVATGVLVRAARGFERVGEEPRDLDRVIVADGATWVAGESGVFSVRNKP